MQSDRELLELAAKAAGIAGEVEEFFVSPYSQESYLAIGTENGAWSSLRDDGDALRLAVKLGLTVMCDLPGGYTRVWVSCTSDGWEDTPHAGDPNAATRRAITLAAAQLAQAAQEGK